METDKSLDDLLKEAEIKRIQAETRRINAEKSKKLLEKKELQRTLNLPWYHKKGFLQAVTAGIVAVPVIWFYVQEIAIPIYNCYSDL